MVVVVDSLHYLGERDDTSGETTMWTMDSRYDTTAWMGWKVGWGEIEEEDRYRERVGREGK